MISPWQAPEPKKAKTAVVPVPSPKKRAPSGSEQQPSVRNEAMARASPAKSVLPDVDSNGIDWILKGHALMGKQVRYERGGKFIQGTIVKYALEATVSVVVECCWLALMSALPTPASLCVTLRCAWLQGRHSFGPGPLFHVEMADKSKAVNLSEKDATAALKMHQTMEKEERMAAREKRCAWPTSWLHRGLIIALWTGRAPPAPPASPKPAAAKKAKEAPKVRGTSRAGALA